MRTGMHSGLAVVILSVAVFVLPGAAMAAEESAGLFKSKCAMCHGPDGAGKTMMGEKLKIPDLRSAEVQKKSEAELKSIIAKGKDKMPAYGTKLSKEEIDKLADYIRDLAKKQ